MKNLNVYYQLGFYLAEALALNEKKMSEEDRIAAIRASHARVKAKKDPASVIKEKPKSKDPKSKEAKVNKEINKAMGKAKVGYVSKTSGKKGVAGLAHDIKTSAKEKLEAHKKKQQELIDKESEG